jgi:uncharacterized protein (DUF983 family)
LKSKTFDILRNGLCKKCPRCGKAPLFEKRFVLYKNCLNCGLEIRAREPNTWFFMYMTTAGITGFFLAVMWLSNPTNAPLARYIVIGAALPFFFATISLRKSLAIALDYLF